MFQKESCIFKRKEHFDRQLKNVILPFSNISTIVLYFHYSRTPLETRYIFIFHENLIRFESGLCKKNFLDLSILTELFLECKRKKKTENNI